MPEPTRFLRPLGERTYAVHDSGTVKGQVWHPAGDDRWRASAPNGVEWHPWRFFRSPQEAARYCVDQYDRL